jgi:ABC-2 type transport system permease protein
MKLINLINLNLKRMMKNKTSFLLSFILPIVVTMGIGFAMNDSPDSSRGYYMVNSDKGIYGEYLIKELSKDFTVKAYTREQGIEKLKKKIIPDFYEINEDFTESLENGQKPQLSVNRRESMQSFSDFEIQANEVINKLLISAMIESVSGEKVSLDSLDKADAAIKVVSTKSTSMASQMTINFLISFNLFVAIGMCYELVALKNEKTLRRSLTTANSPATVIGAVFGAQFIIVILGYTVIFFANAFINNRELLPQAPIIMLNLTMTTAVALSLAIFVDRIVKNEKLIVIVLQIILCGTSFIGGSFMPLEYLPKGITTLSRFTPQYWAIESIKAVRYEYSLIVLLFAVLLFTAGTVSAKSFAEA